MYLFLTRVAQMITKTIKIRDSPRKQMRQREISYEQEKKRDQGNTDRMRKDKWPRENGAWREASRISLQCFRSHHCWIEDIPRRHCSLFSLIFNRRTFWQSGIPVRGNVSLHICASYVNASVDLRYAVFAFPSSQQCARFPFLKHLSYAPSAPDR